MEAKLHVLYMFVMNNSMIHVNSRRIHVPDCMNVGKSGLNTTDTRYKSLVMSRLDYASQLWSPYLLKHVALIEKVQRAFTKYITGMRYLSYSKRLEVLKLYSLGERDIALFMCGKLSRDWFQTSLIPSLALSLIVGEELAWYVIVVLVDWAP